MIVVDSSVWIAKFRGTDNKQVRLLREFTYRQEAAVGDAIILELMQGCRTESEAELLARNMRQFRIFSMLTPDLAFKAAANYRFLRRRGITIRKTIDLIIATYCIEHGHTLLQADRDFLPIAEHLGLQLA